MALQKMFIVPAGCSYYWQGNRFYNHFTFLYRIMEFFNAYQQQQPRSAVVSEQW